MALSARAKRGAGSHVTAPVVHGPYDPMRLYARMAKFYKWTFESMEQMHFVTFFAFVREAAEINREEAEETARARRTGYSTPTVEAAQGMFEEAVPYTGETVAI